MRVLVLVLLLAGCGAPPPRFPVETSVTTTSREVIGAAPTTTPPTPTKSMSNEARGPLAKAACESGGPFNPTSRPYAGAGPHPIIAHEVLDPASHMQHSSVASSGDATMFLSDVNLIQLVACVVPVVGARSGTVTCYFTEGDTRDWPLHEASYQVTLREARTGRVVTTVTAAGDETAKDSCPLFGTDYSDSLVARSLTWESLGKAVEPIRNGEAR
ncbi:hypothetical protein [Lentzea sp. NPDC092896]|uniref:hypothetical protein n=1 Tax=Lentzea sp. NPDC092896 TaxID=3364127 RepID=UPI0037FF1C5A